MTDATDATEATTLVQREDCGAAIPVIVHATGELQPLGTGGDCPVGRHTFTLHGRTIAPRGETVQTGTPVRK